MQNKATGIRRARSGCWNCKEELPSCRACIQRHLRCDYGVRLVWQDDCVLLGRAFGRAGLGHGRRRPDGLQPTAADHYLLPLSPASPASRFHWLHTTVADLAAALGGGDACTRPCSPASPHVSRPLGDFPDLSSQSGFLLEYYIRIWSSRQVLSDAFDNPYQRLILPLCRLAPGLLHAVLAFAAHDLRNQHRDRSPAPYDAVLLHHKTRSLQHVRQLLAADAWATTADLAARDALLLTILLHARLEIANNSTHEWVVHIQGALSAVRHVHAVRGDGAAFSRDVREFALSCLLPEGTFYATTTTATATAAALDIAAVLPLPPSDRARCHVSGYTGISREMLHIIASITAAIRARNRAAHLADHLSDHLPDHHTANSLYARLGRLRQWSDDPDPDRLVNLNAAAFAEAAWIYLRHGLLGEPCDSVAIQTSHLPRLLALLQNIHRRRHHPVGSQPYPMWALFVAACVAQEDTRARVMDRFVELSEQRPYSNVPVTTAAVQAIWKNTDLRWCASAGAAGREAGLVWDAAIHRLGWMMSLT